MEAQGVLASAGSACHSHTHDDTSMIEISSVLKAMHVPHEYAFGTIRLSIGRTTTQFELEHAVSVIASSVHHLYN